jgi:hypothetical protein
MMFDSNSGSIKGIDPRFKKVLRSVFTGLLLCFLPRTQSKGQR